ncbi:MAG: Rrf2 family transcriptional regulator [Candidatus Saganbacteria bacterium]|nr:Rrf2 family transcriptional regulator [Candidatus Saganbacteria bacterium]
MKLTKASDYTIRLLTYLAKEKGLGKSKELARELDIPFNHLAKLVQILSKRGYLLTRKGKGGGLELAKNPKKINLAEIIEVIEGPIVLSDCLFNRQSCRFSGRCKARKCLSQLGRKMSEFLSKTTIQDLVPIY